MKKSDIYDAVSGIDEKYCIESEDIEGIAAEFKRIKIHKMKKILSFAACFAVIFMLGINIYNRYDLLDPSVFTDPSYSDKNDSAVSETEKTTDAGPLLTSQYSSSETSALISGESKTTFTAVTDITEQANDNAAEQIVTSFVTAETSRPSAFVTTQKPVSTAAVPVVTFPVTTGKPVITAASAVTTAAFEPTEPPEIITSVSPMPELPPVTTKAEHPDDGSQDSPGGGSNRPPGGNPQEPPNLELNISQLYAACVFNGGYYKTINKTADKTMIGEYLGTAEMLGYDPYTDTNCRCTALIYKMIGIPESEQLAVLFPDKKEFFIYSQ